MWDGKRNLVAAIAAIVFVLFGAGCRKSTTAPALDTSVSSSQDAAQSIANAMGEDNGGVTDQMGDIADATGSAGISSNVGAEAPEGALMKTVATAGDSVVKTFNTADTSWTIFVSRVRVGLFGRQAGFTRTYYVKFINKDGVALPRYITLTSPADTAYSMIFMVENGTGHIITRFVSTHLLSLSSSFLVAGTNTTTLTFNGSFTRTGTDTITTLTGQRVLNYTLTATLQNVTRPRVPRYTLGSTIVRATGGTITGTYTAAVSVLKGDSYSERNFTKTFTVTFGDNTGTIDVDGSKFNCDLQSGEAASN